MRVADVCSTKFCRIQINEGKRAAKFFFRKRLENETKNEMLGERKLVLDEFLKINSLATHEEILAAAIKKHGDFKKRYDSEGN